MGVEEILRYIYLVDRRFTILQNSGVHWEPEYELELEEIDKELKQLRAVVEEEHNKRK